MRSAFDRACLVTIADRDRKVAAIGVREGGREFREKKRGGWAAKLEKAKRGKWPRQNGGKRQLTGKEREKFVRECPFLSASEADATRLALAELGKGRSEPAHETVLRRLRKSRLSCRCVDGDSGGRSGRSEERERREEKDAVHTLQHLAERRRNGRGRRSRRKSRQRRRRRRRC